MLSLYFTTQLNPKQSNLRLDHNSFLDHECFLFTSDVLARHFSWNFKTLVDLSASDNLGVQPRYQMWYFLLSVRYVSRLVLHFNLAEPHIVHSVMSVFHSASWAERECFDLFGVFFSGHTDLRRILTDYGFTGYPLKKDFPVVGYVEVVYDEELENVIYVKTSLVQSKRDFFYESLWK
jgi:NADH:ubiquinone oxidoreductase subunit C